MSYVIAMAGKGGSGKTTIAGLIVKVLKENNAGSVFAIDADPNSNLGEVLGATINENIGRILDDIAAGPDKIPAGMSKERFIEYRVQSSIVECEGFDLLSMGKPEGPGCYCYVNNVLRNCMGKLIKEYDYTVIDNEAGLEHLSRRTTRACDTLLVVSDPTKVGLLSAKRINTLAQELDITIGKRILLVNRSHTDFPEGLVKETGLECIGKVPVDNDIMTASFNGTSLLELSNESASLVSLRKMGELIWH
ncbi:MAG: AAA family ATPase [Candidatus Omnitrophica bacterium]|nr:AAA family ATPase [Candidatus Omnitrophota bacterium]